MMILWTHHIFLQYLQYVSIKFLLNKILRIFDYDHAKKTT